MPTPLSRTKIASDRELPRPSIKRNKFAKRKRAATVSHGSGKSFELFKQLNDLNGLNL
jgi:hypothetical protein